VAATTFKLTELTGERRTLELGGRALPKDTFTLEGKQRAEFTWYPGNPRASVQMLGTEESPSTLSGYWKDRFLKTTTAAGIDVDSPQAMALWNGQRPEDALALTLAVEQLRLGGQLLQMKWDEQVREGILLRFKQTWHRREDVEWEMEFQWTSRGEPAQPTTFAVTPAVDTVSTTLRAKTDDLLEKAAPVFEVVAGFNRALDNLLNEIDAAASSVSSTAVNLAGLISTPQDAVKRVLSSVVTMKESAGKVVSLVDSVPAMLIENDAALRLQAAEVANTPVVAEVGNTMRVTTWVRGVRAAARSLELVAAEEMEKLRALLNMDDLLAAFIARDNSDLRDVSMEYYGTQEQWRRLRSYNRFRSSRLIAGDLVLVPKLTYKDRAS
jgi:hypothetical protein